MNVLAPSATIITTKMKALRRPYIRSSDGAISGARAGPDGIATMPLADASPARCRAATIAVVCAVRQTPNAMISSDRERRRRSRRPAASAAPRPATAPTSSATPSAERADDAEASSAAGAC